MENNDNSIYSEEDYQQITGGKYGKEIFEPHNDISKHSNGKANKKQQQQKLQVKRDENVAVLKYTLKNLLNLFSQKSHKNSKNKNLKKKSIAERVINLKAESKATQQAIALLKQTLFEFAKTHKDDLARERERRF